MAISKFIKEELKIIRPTFYGSRGKEIPDYANPELEKTIRGSIQAKSIVVTDGEIISSENSYVLYTDENEIKIFDHIVSEKKGTFTAEMNSVYYGEEFSNTNHWEAKIGS